MTKKTPFSAEKVMEKLKEAEERLDKKLLKGAKIRKVKKE